MSDKDDDLVTEAKLHQTPGMYGASPVAIIQKLLDRIATLEQHNATLLRVSVSAEKSVREAEAALAERDKLLRESQESIGGDWRQRRDAMLDAAIRAAPAAPRDERAIYHTRVEPRKEKP